MCGERIMEYVVKPGGGEKNIVGETRKIKILHTRTINYITPHLI